MKDQDLSNGYLQGIRPTTPEDVEKSVSQVRSHIDGILERHMEEEDRRFIEMQQELREMRNDLRILTESWQQAKGVVSFMKWIAGIGGSIGAWFLFFKDHWK